MDSKSLHLLMYNWLLKSLNEHPYNFRKWSWWSRFDCKSRFVIGLINNFVCFRLKKFYRFFWIRPSLQFHTVILLKSTLMCSKFGVFESLKLSSSICLANWFYMTLNGLGGLSILKGENFNTLSKQIRTNECIAIVDRLMMICHWGSLNYELNCSNFKSRLL